MRVLNDIEIKQLEDKIKSFEHQTGGELRVALLKASDPYPGASYRQVLVLSLILSSITEIFIPLTADQLFFVILGMVIVLLCIADYLPGKRWFILKREIEREVEERALSLFFMHGLSQTKNRIGMLLMISMLERKVELIVDKTILEKFGQATLDQVVNEITAKFKQGQFTVGLDLGLTHLQEELLKHFPGGIKDEIHDELTNTVILG